MRINRSDPEIKEKMVERRRYIASLSPKHVFKLAIFNARKRAAVSITDIYLFELWESQEGRCAISGLQMTWGKGRIEPTSISLDRINSKLGYEADNVRLVCHAVNCFRGRMLDYEMIEIARTIVAYADQPFAPFTFVA